MNLHLAEISIQVTPGSIAVVICDGAGWHQRGEITLPDTDGECLGLPKSDPSGTREWATVDV